MKYTLIKHYYNGHGQIKDFVLGNATTVVKAREKAIKNYLTDLGDYRFSTTAIEIQENGIKIGSVKYEKSTGEFWWYSDRKADPMKKYHMRIVNRNGTFAKRTLFDNI